MNSLLPQVLWHGVRSKSAMAASQSFALIALILLIVLLLELESLRAARVSSPRLRGLTVVSLPLLVATALTISVRLASIVG